jgi:NAD(P)-dependent dehydrogenase (short-subunit alcohol dehydrogenase family)
MKVIVITGSTRGIGFGLAEAFLSRSCAVVVSGRTATGVAAAVEKLQAEDATRQILGIPCDVSDFEQVQQLWDETVSQFGQVDIWINNAGLSGPQNLLWEQPPETAQVVVNTNLLGVIYGAKVAINGMLTQGSGAIYNMEGMGSDGRMHTGLSLYGMSKYGLKYLNDALAKEAKDTPILIGALRPGMVITALVLDQYRDRPDDWQKIKPIFNIIADRVETVTPWLADRMLANNKSGVRFNWSSTLKIMGRFITAPLNKRDIFTDIEI